MQTLSLWHHSGCLVQSAEIIPAHLIRIMPAQGNVTATTAVLRMKQTSSMKKQPLLRLSCLVLGFAFHSLFAQQSEANNPAATPQPTMSQDDTATDIESIEAAMVNAVNLGKSRSNLSSIVVAINNKIPLLSRTWVATSPS